MSYAGSAVHLFLRLHLDRLIARLRNLAPSHFPNQSAGPSLESFVHIHTSRLSQYLPLKALESTEADGYNSKTLSAKLMVTNNPESRLLMKDIMIQNNSSARHSHEANKIMIFPRLRGNGAILC